MFAQNIDCVHINDLPYFKGITHLHYENMSMQYTAIFHGCKIDNFQMKKCDIFLIFAQSIMSLWVHVRTA